jgi:hypothetical protein
MKRSVRLLALMFVAVGLLSCGEQPLKLSGPAGDNVIVKDASKATESASLELVTDVKPVLAFTYSKEKTTAEEKKYLSKFDKDARDDSPHLKIDLDPKAIFTLLRKGGVLRVALKGERVLDFKFEAAELSGLGGVGASSRIAENGKGDYSDVSIGATETGVSMGIRTLEREYEVIASPYGKGYFLIHTDPTKRVSHHGVEPNEARGIMGGPPIPIPPKQVVPNDDLPKVPGSAPATEESPKKKAVTSGANIRIGFMLAPQAASELTNVNSLIPNLFRGLDWLNTAMTVSSTGVTFTVVAPPEPVGIIDYGKPLEELLRELNSPNTIRADVAAFRLKNNVDVLIVIVGANRGISEGYGGFALIGGNALQSTIVVTNEALTTEKIAHEVGHLLGADHHTAQRTGAFNVSPYYGHINPQESAFLNAPRKADIMMDITKPMWNCTGAGANPCKQEKVFSDPVLVARTTLIDSGIKEAAGCAWQLPIGASLCPVGQCRTYAACPYSLEYGYCAGTGPNIFIPTTPISAANTFCVPQTKLVGLWGITQYYGIPNVSNVASLWKSPRAAEVASFRDSARPFLTSAISGAITPALLLLL